MAFYKEFESLKSVSTVQNENKKFRIEDFSELITLTLANSHQIDNIT